MRKLDDKVMETAAVKAKRWADEKKENSAVARWAYEAGYRACHVEGPALTLAECVKVATALSLRFGGVADNYGEIMHIVLKTLENNDVLR